MIDFFFPDTTALVTFTMMGRQDLLTSLLAGRGRWTVTIAAECRRSSQEPGLEGMTEFDNVLGDPWIPLPAERTDTQLYRSRLAVAGDPDTRHLGEAETIAVVTSRGPKALFITDDLRARQLAHGAGVQTATTLDLLRISVRTKLLSEDTLMALLQLLAAQGRHLAGAPTDPTAMKRWLAG
ncbi:MAG: hypothetical protein ACRCSP_00350 [Rhodoglobus sp.]